jgi:hypothetical protein
MKTLLSTVAFCALSALALNATAQRAVQSTDTVRHFVDAQGREVTLTSGQPMPVNYGPRPSFDELDRNHDGVITPDEAEAYIPLANDFDNVAFPRRDRITRAQYERWDKRR